MQLGMLSAIITGCLAIWCNLAGQAFVKDDGVLWLVRLGLVLPCVLFCFASFPIMAAPAQSGARKFGLLVMLLAHLQLMLVLIAIPFVFRIIFAMFAIAAGLLFHVCFVVYLNRLSRFVGRSDLESGTSMLLMGFIIVPLALWGISSAAYALLQQIGLPQLALVWGAGGLLFAMWYTTVISAVRTALGEDRSSIASPLDQQLVSGTF